MGAWGYQTFEDDTTLDWVYDLIDATDPIQFLKKSLNPDDPEGYLDYDSGCGILGAAEAVHAVLIGHRYDPPDEFEQWVRAHRTLDVKSLLPDCKNGLNQVLGDSSELNELWAENEEDYLKWCENVQQLLNALTAS